MLEDESDRLCVRTASDGKPRVVHGGSVFVNPVEVALANAVFSGDPIYLSSIPADTNILALQRSVNRVAAEFGISSGAEIIRQLLSDPIAITSLSIAIGKKVENSVGGIRTTTSGARMTSGVTPSLPNALAGSEADTYVYFGVRDGKRVYVGITSDLTRRQAQHGDRFFVEPITTDPVTRGQARAIEQALIVQNPQFENINNSISPRHSWYQEAVHWGEWWLHQKGY